MSMWTIGLRSFRQSLGMAVAVGTLALASSTVFAGECPADQIKANAIPAGATMPEGVTDEVLSSIDLSKEAIHVKDRLFRLRRLVIQPGGIVPWHEHGDRPALIYIIEGNITEYSSNCAVPIVHKGGEAAMESAHLAHWWKNTGDQAVVLLSADILHMESKDDHVM